MEEGRLYDPNDRQFLERQMEYQLLVQEYNRLSPLEEERQQSLLRQMFADFGEGSFIQAPFYANWGGSHVHVGNHVYANFNLTLVDDAEIFIGDYVMIGPNVILVTAGHPVEPHLRKRGLQFNADVHIGENAWIGAGVMILPGVTIGRDTVVGAGSVVTKDLPAGVVAVGNPCRILREIGPRDREIYFRQRKVDLEVPED